jgi:hypothetical protein
MVSFPGVKVDHSGSNCKLTNLDNIKNMPLTDIEKVKEFFKDLRIIVAFNTNNENILKFFKTNFELYSVAEIPVGYRNGFQYHIIVRNAYSRFTNIDCLRPISKEQPNKGVDLAKIEEIMTKTLKAKRRKTDIVKEVLDNLK